MYHLCGYPCGTTWEVAAPARFMSPRTAVSATVKDSLHPTKIYPEHTRAHEAAQNDQSRPNAPASVLPTATDANHIPARREASLDGASCVTSDIPIADSQISPGVIRL